MKRQLSLYIILILFSIPIFSQNITNFIPEKDNTIYSENTNSNGIGKLFSGKNRLNNSRRALLKFDLSSIPNGATINQVTLTLSLINNAPSSVTADTYNIYEITKDWGEGNSITTCSESGGGTGTDAQPPDATWVHAMFGSMSWDTNGGDFLNSSIASLEIQDAITNTFLSTSNFVSLVQKWVDNPSNNFGIILIGNESKSSSARSFGSKDCPTAPVLSVSWTAALSVDEFTLSHFRIYPNPTSNSITIPLPSSINEASISIYNILGKNILVKNIKSNSSTINIASLTNGLYIASINYNNKTFIKRFIKI